MNIKAANTATRAIIFVRTRRIQRFAFITFIFLLCRSMDSVAQENVPPEITGQTPLTTEEATSIEIQFNNLIVSDPDNEYPVGFTMTVEDGGNYTVSGATVTPAIGFAGDLQVPVSVNDGQASSESFPLTITVTATPNAAPVITGQVPVSTTENTPVTIALSHLTVEDPDNVYPTEFTLLVQPGENYTVSGATITPLAGFSGILSVPVTVNDGENDSEVFLLSVQVDAEEPENIAPQITGQVSLSTEENTPITIAFTDLTVNDPDDSYPDGFTMTLTAGANYTFTGRTVTPNTGFTGTLAVLVVVNDGEASSNSFSLQISVTPAPQENIKPVITGQSELTTEEDKPIMIQFNDLQVADSDDNYPGGFTIQLADGANYSISGRTVQPDPGFTGMLTVPVTVNDGKDTSDPFGLVITVDPKPAENVAPSIIGQVPLEMLNTESLTIELAHLVVSDPDNNYPADFTLTVRPGDNYTRSGRTVTPSNNFSGILSVRVTVNDGKAESDRFELKITVTAPAPNIKPVITGQQELTTFRNTPITLRLTHLVVTDPDNDYPAEFTLDILPGNNYTVSGNEIRPSAGFLGDLSVGVRVNDGTDWSDPFNALINVVEKNELRITGQEDISIREDSTFSLLLTQLIVNDPSGGYPEGYSLILNEGENYSFSGSEITPAPDFSGTLEIPVQVSTGASSSNVFRLVVFVTPVNDAPAFSSFDEATVPYSIGDGAVSIGGSLEVVDPDNTELVFAEVFINAESFDAGKDLIAGESTPNIRTVYDPNTGVLALLGKAGLQEYQEALRNVTYTYASDTLPEVRTKQIGFRLNDGAALSEVHYRSVEFGEGITLDIPNVFTPNGDESNDTWSIRGQGDSPNTKVTIRVFDKRGAIVHESHTLSTPWDGRYRGQILPADTYFYTIEVTSNANSMRKKGVVTILR